MREDTVRRVGEKLRRLERAVPRLGARGYFAIAALALLAFSLPGLERSVESGAAGDAVTPTPAQVAVAASATPLPATPTVQTSGLPPVVAEPPVVLEDEESTTVDGRPTPSSRGGERPAPTSTPAVAARPAAALSIQEQFIVSNVADAQQSQQETGVPASVTLAQAMLESDIGRSKLAQTAKNFFGIKASGGPGPAGVVTVNTWEVIRGANVTVQAAFRAYNTAAESFADHGRFLRDNARYAEAMKNTDDPRLFARLIHKAGYATDPQYADKLIRLMDRYDLYQHDLR